jgi:Peptidase family M23
MRMGRELLLCGAFLAARPCFADDPRPPQLTISYLAQPAPIVQHGATELAYEMVITNFSNSRYVLNSIDARAGDARFSFAGRSLADMIVHLGAWGDPKRANDFSIEGGGSLIVFLLLDFGGSQAPDAIAHSIHVVDDKNAPHDMALAPLSVSQEKPIVIAAPLRGDWIAGDSLNNGTDAAHRRAVLVANGRAWISQRYAIDWVQYQTVDGVRTTWRGPEDKNESYFCYDKPIYSVAAGTVVQVLDGLAENIPHSGKYATPIDFDTAGGNHVVVEIAPRRYVLYAHMRPGSLRVKLGDTVHAGDVLGHVGNTGSSTEPHLHMHVDDQPSFLAGNGVPYEFASGEASGPVEANVSSPGAVRLGSIGPQQPFTDDYPAENALVTFK